MEESNPTSDLINSLDAIRELTTFCKTRNIVFHVAPPNGGAKIITSPGNPSKTRWLGVLKQVRLYLKAKLAVLEHARREPSMLVITDKISWELLEAWLECCSTLKTALMHGQLSTKPNIHHCIHDLMIMLTELTLVADRTGSRIIEEIAAWAKFEILGLCHKTLRVLAVPHFAGCLLNPGVGHIPDLNLFLP